MDAVNCDKKEAIELRHRKEKKELQSKVQLLKKSATKGDKKKKKEVAEEIARIEEELEKKHIEELLQLETDDLNSEIDAVAETLENVSSNFKEISHRPTKAQKRRDKKAQQEKEREKEIEAQEKLNIYGARNLETQKIKSVLKEKNLMVHEIPSDGNCLYCAVDHQLTLVGEAALGLEKLRLMTSEFLLSHCNDYLPFMSHPETGDVLTQEQYEEYCNKVASTSAWGGEIELQALSRVLGRRIQVIQAVGPTITVGEEFSADKQLTLTYHRHMYGLGEHYNSVRPYEEPPFEEVS